MTEPDVTLTDYVIALECLLICYLLRRPGGGWSGLRSWAVVFFAATAVAALLGGTVHGFFVEETLTGYKILWPATLLAIGVSTLAAWNIGGHVLFGPTGRRRLSLAALLAFGLYCGVVLFLSEAFLVAVANYLPASLFLLVALTLSYRRQAARPLALGLVGLLLTFLAGGVQQLGIGLHPLYFNHNALYHVIQAVALWLLFVGFRWLAEREEETLQA